MSDFDPLSVGSPDPKRDLRRQLLAARRAIKNRQDSDEVVRATLVAWVNEARPGTVAAYVPMTGEPGGPELPGVLADLGIRVLLPVVLPNRDLDWAEYGGPGTLAPAAMGLTEATGPRLGVDAVGSADVVIVPALAVDRGGMRLGRGGGSYDRALARVRPGRRILALLYPGEFRDEVPSEPHDRPVDGVVVDGRVILISGGHRRAPAGR